MRAVCLVLAALCLVACDAGGDPPAELGTFEAEVRGGVTRDLSGVAGYLDGPAGPGSGLFVSLTETSGRSIAINDPDRALEAVGTYAVNDLDGRFVGVTYSERLGDVAGRLRAVDGTVRVTAAGDGRIEGTVTARLAAGVEREPTSTLEATFRARRVTSPR